MVGRLHSDRILRFPAPTWIPGTNGRPPKHGPKFRLTDPTSRPAPDAETATTTPRYGTATAEAWDRLHPRLTHRAAWVDYHGELPIIEATPIRLSVDYLPGDRNPKPVWLWSSATGATTTGVNQAWC